MSVATVSRALRGLDRVSPPHPRPRLRRGQELHYVASPTATSLVSGRTRGSAVITPFFNRWFFATLISGIEKALRARSYHVLLCDLEGHTFDHQAADHADHAVEAGRRRHHAQRPPEPEERVLVDRLGCPSSPWATSSRGWPSVRIDDRGGDGAGGRARLRARPPRDRLRRAPSRLGRRTSRRPWTGSRPSPSDGRARPGVPARVDPGARLDRAGAARARRPAVLGRTPARLRGRGLRRDGVRRAERRPPARSATCPATSP